MSRLVTQEVRRGWDPLNLYGARFLCGPLPFGLTVPSGAGVRVPTPRTASSCCLLRRRLGSGGGGGRQLLFFDLGPSLSLQQPPAVARNPAATRHLALLTAAGAGAVAESARARGGGGGAGRVARGAPPSLLRLISPTAV